MRCSALGARVISFTLLARCDVFRVSPSACESTCSSGSSPFSSGPAFGKGCAAETRSSQSGTPDRAEPVTPCPMGSAAPLPEETSRRRRTRRQQLNSDQQAARTADLCTSSGIEAPTRPVGKGSFAKTKNFPEQGGPAPLQSSRTRPLRGRTSYSEASAEGQIHP